MSKKALKINQFGECILSEYELFSFNFTTVRQKYPDKPECNPDIYQALFNWSWNGYSGNGEIGFYRSSMSICNSFGENYSNMTVASCLEKQQPTGRRNCALNNDPSLEALFNKMLSFVDL